MSSRRSSNATPAPTVPRRSTRVRGSSQTPSVSYPPSNLESSPAPSARFGGLSRPVPNLAPIQNRASNAYGAPAIPEHPDRLSVVGGIKAIGKRVQKDVGERRRVLEERQTGLKTKERIVESVEEESENDDDGEEEELSNEEGPEVQDSEEAEEIFEDEEVREPTPRPSRKRNVRKTLTVSPSPQISANSSSSKSRSTLLSLEQMDEIIGSHPSPHRGDWSLERSLLEEMRNPKPTSKTYFLRLLAAVLLFPLLIYVGTYYRYTYASSGSVLDPFKFMNAAGSNGTVIMTGDQFAQFHAFNYDVSKRVAMLRTEFTRLSSTVEHVHNEFVGFLKAYRNDRANGGRSSASTSNTAVNGPNFFSPRLGAGAIPMYTSPTYVRGQRTILASAYNFVLGRLPRQRPIQALQSWEDVGDCWCAAPGSGAFNKKKLDDAGDVASSTVQLGVRLGGLGHDLTKRLVLSEFVLEHVPRSQTLEPGAAPREVEIWVNTASASIDQDDYTEEELDDMTPAEKKRKAHETRLELLMSSLGTHPTHTDKPSWPDPLAILPNHFYRLASFVYDSEGADTQRFEVPSELRHEVFSAREVVVRVGSNWGSEEMTCLYRVKGFGKMISESEK